MCIDTVDVYGKIKSYLNIICAEMTAKQFQFGMVLKYSKVHALHAQNNHKE